MTEEQYNEEVKKALEAVPTEFHEIILSTVSGTGTLIETYGDVYDYESALHYTNCLVRDFVIAIGKYNDSRNT